ncbi:hypothetical protein JTY93_23785 [Pseudomonas hygromyciniae]|uniref:Uncharacterized protein n=1 Tax=Pseudomonas hygromyciniae TaxID=2812000 RepID=A0ABX7JVW6_9PSED|nr:hypothetical protein [Pseudomonas hygromyciniae]QSB39178.1 hypothetical protein JTY93_23785 [Pseudomonas hygromyciniae]
MMRIRGTIGELPVDLTLELDDSDWARLGVTCRLRRRLAGACHTASLGQSGREPEAGRPGPLREAGQLSGLELSDRLEGLAGNAQAGKRLLVRLRHSAKVKVSSGGDTPQYSWIAD